MKIAILGGGGFIGSAVIDRLLADRHDLRVLDRVGVAPHRRFGADERLVWIHGDLSNRHDTYRTLDDVDAVVHLACTTLPKASGDDPVFDVQSNLVPTLKLLQAMAARKVPRIVFLSSGGTVYGDPVRLPIDERHPTEPRTAYGITKLALEKHLLLYRRHHGIDARILRVANAYGERQRVDGGQGALTTFIHRAVLDRPVEIWGDGTTTRDYIHVTDVAAAVARALDYRGDESVFNIGTGHGTNLRELVTLVEQVLQREIQRVHRPGRPLDVATNILDIALAGRELGWTPAISLREGIARTAAWIESTTN